MLLSLWCSDYAEHLFFSKMRKGIKKRKNLWYCTAGKVVQDKKLEEYQNENYYFLWWSDKQHFPYNSLGLTDEDNSVSRTDNFVNVNVFNSVTSARVLSYCWVLHYFSTIPVGRIKIVTVYKRSIFQVECLIATLILCISHCSESDSVSDRDFQSPLSTACGSCFLSFVGELTKTSARPNAGQDI